MVVATVRAFDDDDPAVLCDTTGFQQSPHVEVAGRLRSSEKPRKLIGCSRVFLHLGAVPVVGRVENASVEGFITERKTTKVALYLGRTTHNVEGSQVEVVFPSPKPALPVGTVED